MNQQRGGAFLGFVVGVVVGLSVALAVAVYVTKVPVPFLDKGVNRPADAEGAESERNKNWDPNAPLYGKNPARPASMEQVEKPQSPDSAAGAPPLPELKPAVTGDPLGDLARSADSKSPQSKPAASAGPASAAEPVDPFIYFVQAGAFRNMEEAESLRAKLSLAGLETEISDRDMGGYTMHRVRMGPFQTRAEAERVKLRLQETSSESALVRVTR